jgi:hypothetical protein
MENLKAGGGGDTQMAFLRNKHTRTRKLRRHRFLCYCMEGQLESKKRAQASWAFVGFVDGYVLCVLRLTMLTEFGVELIAGLDRGNSLN